MYVGGFVHVCAVAFRGQQRAMDPFELELEAYTLRPELPTTARPERALSY